MMRPSILLAIGAVLLLASCTSRQLEGTSPAYLIIDSLQAASGAMPSSFANTLSSDVLTFVTSEIDGTDGRVPTIFEDMAQVEFALGLKDPGGVNATNIPTATNFITITRYRVRFIRTDGRDAAGVDVPYPFDGAVTATVGVGSRTITLVLVRSQAKQEAPLRALVGGGGAGVISTIAEVTFFGADQAGREVSVTGRIGVSFADWNDPL